MATTFAPHTGDGPRTRATLADIQAGKIKKTEAAKALQQARYLDHKDAANKKGGQQ